jgi:DNA gyrase subunit B
MARSSEYQALLPIRGKILNVQKASLQQVLDNVECSAIVQVLGAGSGRTFDIGSMRYGRVMIMADADVDGSHIRTLILTFFFRYMREVIERGYLFIAQPPLFKVSQGKKDSYIKDEGELSRFLLNRISENVEVTPQVGMSIRSEALIAMLQRMEEYRNHGRKVASRGIPRDAVDVLLAEGFNDRAALQDPEKVESVVRALAAAGYVDVESSTDDESELTTIRFRLGANTTGKAVHINAELLSQYEFRQMVKTYDLLTAFGLPPYTLKHGEETTMTLTTFDALIDTIYELAKKGLAISRYKGLGEMNPEQLWETTMNPETRRLLQVRIEDGVGAEELFTILMGDQVEPRRLFIQDNALEVKNLDI